MKVVIAASASDNVRNLVTLMLARKALVIMDMTSKYQIRNPAREFNGLIENCPHIDASAVDRFKGINGMMHGHNQWPLPFHVCQFLLEPTDLAIVQATTLRHISIETNNRHQRRF